MLKKISIFIVAFYAVFSFIILPFSAQSIVDMVMEKKSYATLKIEKVRFNPFFFSLNIKNATLSALDGEKIVSLGELDVNLDPTMLVMGMVNVKSVMIDGFDAFIVRQKSGEFNFEKIIKPQEEDDDSKPPRVVVDSIVIKNSGVHYTDNTKSVVYKNALTPISVRLANIDTKDFSSTDGKFRFHTFLEDGGEIDIHSNITSLKPFGVNGEIKIDGMKLHKKWPYLQDGTKVEIADGTLNAGAKFAFNVDELNSTKISDVFVGLQKLRIKPKDRDSDIITLGSFLLSGAEVTPFAKEVKIKSISLDEPKATLVKKSDGSIDLTDYFSSDKKNKQPENNQSHEKPWSLALESVSLKKMGLSFNDTSIAPAVESRVNELNLIVKNIALPSGKPFFYDLSLLVNEKLSCSSKGSIKLGDTEVDAHLKCADFDVVHYLPYIDKAAAENLKTYNVQLKSAMVDLELDAAVRKDEILLANLDFALRDVAIADRDKNKVIAGFKLFGIEKANINTKQKKVFVAKTALDGLFVDAVLQKDKRLNLAKLIEPKESSKSDKKEASPYGVNIKQIALSEAKLTVLDEEMGAKFLLDKMNLNAKNVDTKARSWLSYDFGVRVNSVGKISSSGELMHTPFAQKGKFGIEKLSLKELNPYIAKKAFVLLKDGSISLDSKTALDFGDGKNDIKADGSFKVENLFLNDSRDNSSLVSFILAGFKHFDYSSVKNELFVDEMLLNSFYLDAQVDKNKSLNLSRLMKPATKQEANTTNNKESKPLNFKLTNLKVSNGSANFADYSLPIQFKTSIHNLNGNVYAISSSKDEISYVDIDGEVDKYGSTQLKGSLESANVKSYMDIDFNFRNLDLSAMSGYSAQFAGYKIDDGKLFLDLKYNILDSQLKSKNKIVIKEIKLGDEIKDSNVTKLPLGFAIALLEDKDGIIDIDMPIEGDVDKPDFKYGAMVWKVFTNLLIKAVASPFKFLGSMMGFDGDKLKNIDFEAAESIILPPEREKLDKLADVLVKKPKLLVAITPSFDKKRDTDALRLKKLKAQVLTITKQEQLVVSALEQIYEKSGGKPKALREEVAKTVKKELIEVQYQKELVARCAAMQAVTQDELNRLADARGKIVFEYLVNMKKIDAPKLMLKPMVEVNDSSDEWIKTALAIEVK